MTYISGKITGNPNAFKQFAEAQQFLINRGVSAINPMMLEGLFGSLEYEQYMQIDYALLNLCDTIFMIDGWQNSNGARAELAYAKSLGKRVEYQRHYKKFKHIEAV